ncbi:MAG: peptidoglycan DD-metalloendopeptidase family protein [Rickettsiales bacterium]
MAKPGRKKAKTAIGRMRQAVFGRLFCKRSIIIISEHETKHVPFSAAKQLLAVLAVVGFIGWASYSSGSYMAAQKVLIEKERKLASTTEENARVESEFNLLKRDLMKLAEESKNGKSSEYAKVIADQYTKPGGPLVDKADASDQYNAVFQRIGFLENKVKELQSTHDGMMADIRSTTGGKIKELEQVIARTGVDATAVTRTADAKRLADEQRREKYGRTEGSAPAVGGGQGGPYQPIPRSVLKEKDTELYFNLRRLMSLNDVVTALPLAMPEAENTFRETSGFGTRTDPFRGTLAFHSGVDLAGPENAKVLATQDGRVEFAGWKTAYGNVVDIKHEYGFGTRYGHLARVLVTPDQYVKKGQVIGIQGSTGRSTGHHLHYEVRYQGRAIDPAKFLKVGEDVRSASAE